MKSPRIYMVSQVGTPETHRTLTQRTGNRSRMFSFARIRKTRSRTQRFAGLLDALREQEVAVFLDSGAFTFQSRSRTGGRTDSVERTAFCDAYVQFCLRHGDRIRRLANFDWCANSRAVWHEQRKLESYGLRPLPVIHGDAGLEWIWRYAAAGHRYAAVGKGVRWGSRAKTLPYLDRVFDIADRAGVALHGFAMTDIEILLRFPWRSVDSAAWLAKALRGEIYVPEPAGRLSVAAVTRLPPRLLDYAAETVREHGFSLPRMRLLGTGDRGPAQWERACWNMYVLEHLRELGVRPGGGDSRKWRPLL